MDTLKQLIDRLRVYTESSTQSKVANAFNPIYKKLQKDIIQAVGKTPSSHTIDDMGLSLSWALDEGTEFVDLDVSSPLAIETGQRPYKVVHNDSVDPEKPRRKSSYPKTLEQAIQLVKKAIQTAEKHQQKVKKIGYAAYTPR